MSQKVAEFAPYSQTMFPRSEPSPESHNPHSSQDSIAPLPHAGCCVLYPLISRQPPLPLSLGRPQSLPLDLGDAGDLSEGCGPPLAPPSPSGAAPGSGSAARAWRRSHGGRLTGSAQSEAAVGGGPGPPPTCRPGLRAEDKVVSKRPGEHTPPPPTLHPSTH